MILMFITLQNYCMLCCVAWAAFAFFFFRKDILKRHTTAPSEAENISAPAVNDIIGHPKTVIDPATAPTSDVTPHAARQKARPVEDEEELDVEYEYDDLETFRAQADGVPPVELNTANVDLDTINAQLAALQKQTDEETMEMLAGDASTVGMHQLELAFETVVAPSRSLENDQEAGMTLKDISRTDMFYQAYRANELRVEEVMQSVRCKILHLDGDELEVVAAKEEDEDTASQNTDKNESDDEGVAEKEDFINGFLNS